MPNATDFDLPQYILDLLRDPNSGVRARVNIKQLQPLQYEVLVWDAQNNLIHTCPHPCRLRSGGIEQ